MKIQKVFGYSCDRCQKELTNDSKVTIYAQKNRLENPKKQFDLCRKCYAALVRAMNKKKEE